MRLLIVDDHETNLRVLRAQLEIEGHDVLDAANGVEALRVLEREPVDGVISDILMPQMDGYRLCLEVRKSKRLASMPFVLYTSTYNSPADRKLAESAGADAYVEKPAPTNVILDALRAAAGRAAPHAVRDPATEIESPVLKQYSEALVRKLEEKSQDLMRAHEGLVQIEARLSGLVASAMDGIVAIDDRHRIVLFNDAAARIFGCSREHALGKPLNDFIPPRHREAHTRHIDGFGTESPAERRMGTRQVWAMRVDGVEFPIEASISQLETSQGRLYTVFIRDITKRYNAEQALAESEERFRQISENVSDVFFLRSLDGTQMLYVSPAYERIWGRSCESLYSNPHSWADAIHPDDQASTVGQFKAGVLQGQFGLQFRIVRPDGSTRWIESRGFPVLDSQGAPVRIAGIAKDITERKLTALKLDRHVGELEILHDMNKAILEAKSPQEMASAGLSSLHRVVPFWGATAMKFDAEGNEAEVLAIEKEAGAKYDPGARLTLDQYGQEDVAVLRRGEIRFVSDLELVTGRSATLDILYSQGMRSYVRIPLMAEGVLIGALNLAGRQKAQFSQEHVDFARPLADQLAISLQQALLRDGIRRLNRVYAVLSGINMLIVRAPDRRELFREACQIAVSEGGFPMAWIGMIEDDGKTVSLAAGAGGSDAYFQTVRARLDEFTSKGVGLVAQAIRDKLPVISSHLETDTRIPGRTDAIAAGARSRVIIPLVVEQKVIGVLALHADTAGFFHEEEMKLLRELAGDISFALDHRSKTERINYLANYDPLTGLVNRQMFVELLSQSLAHSHSHRQGNGNGNGNINGNGNGGMLAVALMDVERFRRVNETLGRAAGDELLRMAAARLKRINPTAARIGVDQFAFKVENVDSVTDVARAVTEVETRCFGEPFHFAEEELRIGCRAGVAVCPGDGEDAETLLRNAEAALRDAKRSADRQMFYAREMNARAAQALSIESRLRRALERGEFLLHYQPKVNLADRRIAGAEALIRWQDPEHGLVPPGQFIGILEETGLVSEVGRWVMGQALRDIRAWRAKGLLLAHVAVNVSAIQLHRKDFVDIVIEEIRHSGDDPELLELEVTESLLMHDVDSTIRKLSILRGLGVCISLDDFGTGYSSLSYLARLPIDTVKIDRAFITNVVNSVEDAAIVSSIIALVHSLKHKVVAEGVEDEEQARFLKLLRCDEIQGFLISRPVPADAFASLLAQEQTGEPAGT